MAKGKDYFGLPYIVSLILAIIPITSWILGMLTRLTEGKIIAFILRLIPIGGFVAWIVDIFSMLTKKKIWRAVNC